MVVDSVKWKEKKKTSYCGDCGQNNRVEDPEITSSPGQTKITTTYRATIYENHMKTARKDEYN